MHSGNSAFRGNSTKLYNRTSFNIFIKCSWDSCFGDYSGNPEGTPGARGRTRKCSGKTWGIEKQVDMNQVTPEEWIKVTGENVQSQTFWGLR